MISPVATGMAKKKTSEGDQGYLIDIHPENKKEIIATAQSYKRAMSQRVKFLDEEKGFKTKLLGLIKEAGITPLEDGKIKFELDGFKISVTPRDELVQVKEIDE